MWFTESFVIVIFLFHNVCSSCVFQDGGGVYDLSLLDWPGGWPVSGPKINGTSTYYEISICNPLNYTSASLSEGCPHSSICEISGGKALSFANPIDPRYHYVILDNDDSDFTLYVTTYDLCDSKWGRIREAEIEFECGPNLGTPHFVLRSHCKVKFYWKTSVACINKPKSHQVPCYVIDHEGNVRDLSHLILKKGGYSVVVGYLENFDFIVNVCSEISGDEGCGSNSSACRVDWNNSLSFGKPHGRLQYTQEGLILSYLTDEIYSQLPKGCSLRPKTTIVFKCPPRHHSSRPALISNYNCQYKVEWYTEYACPQNLKGSLETCQFTTESHGVEIDLRPLKRKPFFNISTIFSGYSTFAISVCGGLKNFICSGKNRKSTSVCGIKKTNSSAIIGTTEGSHLIYAHGIVTLTYPGQESCDNVRNQSTVIKFLCDSKASNNGDGQPIFISSESCIYTFQWRTKHACAKPSFESTVLKWRDYCSIYFKNKEINLKGLFLRKGEAWEATDQRNLVREHNAKYYVNVCGQVSYLGNLSSCGPGSSACVLGSNGKYLNIGNFTMPPIYDINSDSTRLSYIGGSLCKGGKRWKSTIDFFCRPGHINSKPILLSVDESECQYKFKWYTSEACPKGTLEVEGANCKVEADNLGINYDLTPLKHKVYEVDFESYRFYISICETYKPTCVITPMSAESIGNFQEKKINFSSWKIEISDLEYRNGIISSSFYLCHPFNKHAKIVFICDFSAGNGGPQFVKHDGSYIFHWHTNVVCSNSPIECMVQDSFSHLIYDLSLLSAYENSRVPVANKDNKEMGIYLSVCRPLAEPLLCDSKAAACMVENVGENEKAVISNLGQSSTLLVLEGPGHLILKYTNGNICTAYGKNVTYSTTIHFVCAEDKIGNNYLQYLNKVDACEYVFLWSTKAACPTGIVQSFESCQLTDPDSGFTFDLTPLWKANEPYTVKVDFNTTYQLNICGRVVSGCLSSGGKQQSKHVSVCRTDSKGKLIHNIAVSNSYFLSYSTGSDLSISYQPDGVYGREVIIKFPCNKTTADLNPKLISNDYRNDQLIFEMKTSLTCIPSHFDCNVIDEYGNEYDLNPLAKFRKINWEATDNRPSYSHLRYHINFCRPLNKVSSYICPAGSSGACVTNALQNESIGHDLGSQLNEPFVNSKGIIVLRYTHGSYCHNGQFRRSTIVNLFCSGEREDLKFIGETPECEYIFSLATPVACPIQSSVGSACTVREPFFGYIFDLNPLKSNNNYIVMVGEYKFYFNVCDKLNGLQNACINSSACQTKSKDPSFSKSLGLPNDQLLYRNGTIMLKYTSDTDYRDGKCSYSMEITFTCHLGPEEVGPYFVLESKDCTFLFEWPTVHACPLFDIIQCSVIDEHGAYYDLSKLSLRNGNYYVKHPIYEKQFVINVCSIVVHTPHSVCPFASASCLVDISNHPVDEPVNLGKVSQGPYIDNGKIKLNYTSGDPCDAGGTETVKFMQTVIEFICDHSSIDSKPEFLGREGCIYYFDWHTVYACESESLKASVNCTVEDPLTGYFFNLSPLRNRGLFRYEKDNHQYYLSVCGNNDSSPCGADSGMCEEELSGMKRHWSGGKLNSHLIYNNGIIFLNYSDGDPCHNGNFTRNTLIEFRCGHGLGEPRFLYKSHDCTYFFIWKTKFACQTQLYCGVGIVRPYYDLSSIADTYRLAVSSVLNDNASYYISMCNSLQKLPKDSCPPEAAVCRVQNNGSAESLGSVQFAPFVDFMGHVIAVYINGSTCLKNSTFQNHARIIFLCESEAGIGKPVLLTEDDECYFIFEWRTSIVCPLKLINDTKFTFSNNTDDSRNVNFNLLPLQKTETKPYYEVTDGNSSYFLNVCATPEISHLANCKTSTIFKIEGNNVRNYGVAVSQKITYDGQRLKLTFYDGDPCPSDSKTNLTSEVLFVCNPFVGRGEPVLHKKYSCMTIFLWETSLACQKLQDQCSFDFDGSHFDFSLLSSLSYNWNTSDSKNRTYYLNFCHGIQQNNDTFGCLPAAAICMVDLNGFPLSLGMVDTVKVKSFNSTDMLLTFESGDSRACFAVNSDETLKPVTRVFMRCGTKLGQPVIISGPDSKCFYDFVWESSLACSDLAEEVKLEKDVIVKNSRFSYSLDIGGILNRTFILNGTSVSGQYKYEINLNGVSQNSSDSNACSKAAVCQTKIDTNFIRDIGSTDSRIFVATGSTLHITLVSQTQSCVKNSMKNVTTIINLQCALGAGIGSPIFLYESDCVYLFNWETSVVCPDFHKRNLHTKPTVADHFNEEPSNNKAKIAVGIILPLIILGVVAFIFSKPSIRAVISSRFRSLVNTQNIPSFRYKKDDMLTELS